VDVTNKKLIESVEKYLKLELSDHEVELFQHSENTIKKIVNTN
jgi:hypothetical protein